MRKLQAHQPSHVSALLDQPYDSNRPDALLDVFYPDNTVAPASPLTIVWVHGGAWVSGNKNQLSGYARILAARGFTVVTVDYSLSPATHFPIAVREVNAALSYLERHASGLHVDPTRIVLAGDSAGAQIAAVLANAIADPGFARAIGVTPSISRQQLAGALLYCGVYDLEALASADRYRYFLRAILRAYSGTDSFMTDSAFAYASVVRYVSEDFPPTFISAGNADPLREQSVAFAQALARQSVVTRQLFFPSAYLPPLPHEYQFNLGAAGGQLALEQSVQFLEQLSGIDK
ncbi:alpha/beta hydrolase [Paraburkholderia sediminicola]|uniref:alpha/beta hydrolase n=1 Tax=Paraburkholderia sediminicola TaxID=458836 RepID=UPI0038BB3F66